MTKEQADTIIANRLGYTSGTLFCLNSWRDITPEDIIGGSASYGDFEHTGYDEPDWFFFPDNCGGSDYSGCSVTQANYNVLRDEFESLVTECYGGYGTYAIAISVASLESKLKADDELAVELVETLKALQDYPVIDEEEMSEVEIESQSEAWNSWIESDFRDMLTKLQPEEYPRLYELGEDMLYDVELYELLHELSEATSTYWENETGNQAWISLDRLAEAIQEVITVETPYETFLRVKYTGWDKRTHVAKLMA